jgi:hypothetical protein
MELGLPEVLRRFLFRGTEGARWFRKAAKALATGLLPALNEAGFRGLAGLDMMVVRDVDGRLKLRAPLELNPRPTMGHIALALRRPLRKRAVGVWLLLGKRDVELTSCASFSDLLERLQTALPTIHEGQPNAVRQGAFSTNDAALAEQTLSLALVAPELADVLDALSAVGLDDPLSPAALPA